MSNNPKNEPTTGEVLHAVNDVLHAVSDFSSHVDEQFKNVNQRLDRVEDRLDHVESNMVTKDYLDDKLGDLKGDLIVLMRKEDRKVNFLVDILCKRNIITEEDKTAILEMEPFARTS